MTVLTKHHPSPEGQWSVQERSSRLTSPLLQGMSCVRVLLSWRAFTLSASLQRGLRLLRRLRPPLRTLAFSRPVRTGEANVEFPSSNAHDLRVTRSCLLYTGRMMEQHACGKKAAAPSAIPFGVGCLNHFHPFFLTMLT